MDISIKLPGKMILRGTINSPGDHSRAGIILVHGLGEHLGRYNHWLRKFSDRGIAFLGVDLPGHGRSDGKRGYIKNFNVTSQMLNFLTGEYRKTFPGVPVFLYGHSLGGIIVLDYLLKNNPPVRGAVVTAPWLKLAFEPGRFKVLLAGAMKYIMPSLVQPNGLVTDHLSSDRSVVDAYVNDPLVHNKISVSLFHSAVSAAGMALSKAAEIKVPVLLMHASDDKILSPEGSRELASKNKLVELKIWEGGYHEIHNEPFQDQVFEEIMIWMEKNI